MGKKLFDVVFSPISLIVGDKIGHAITGAFLVAAGIATGNLQLAALGIGMAASSFAKKPGVNKANLDRLSASLDPGAPRKIVFGTTAMATDVRYQAYTGANQEYLTRSSASRRTRCSRSTRSGSRTRRPGPRRRRPGALRRLSDGHSAHGRHQRNGIAIDASGPPAPRLTGCAYVYLEYKLTGNSSKATSPFSSGVPSRMTIRGNGALIYDPRLDRPSPAARGPSGRRPDDLGVVFVRLAQPGAAAALVPARVADPEPVDIGLAARPSAGASRRRASTCRASSRPPTSATRRSRSPPAARSRAIAATASSRKATTLRRARMLLGAMNASLATPAARSRSSAGRTTSAERRSPASPRPTSSAATAGSRRPASTRCSTSSAAASPTRRTMRSTS
jgi:hypothetical protein